MLSSELSERITNHQALRYAFKQKDIHGRLARWIDFLAQYEFKINYKQGSCNQAADYLSRFELCETTPDKTDEGELAIFVAREEQDLKMFLKNVREYLLGATVSRTDGENWSNIKKATKQFL